MEILEEKLQEIKKFIGDFIKESRKLYDVKLESGEIGIAIEKTEIEEIDAEKVILSSKTYFSIKNAIDLNPQVITIKSSHIDTLRKNADSKPSQNLAGWVGGMRCIYAIDTNNEFKLYFRPLYFKLIENIYSQGNELHGIFETIEKKDILWRYDYNSQIGFIPIHSGDPDYSKISADIDKYKHQQDGIFIKRTEGNLPKEPYAQNDVTSILYTFQEFIALTDENPKSDEVKIWNYVKKVKMNDQILVQHDLMLSTEDISLVDNGLSMGGKNTRFFDLSHLCPPHCPDTNGNKLLFRLNS